MDGLKTLYQRGYITNDMKLKKVKIFKENANLENSLIDFLSYKNRCTNFKKYIRDYKIEEILSNKDKPQEWNNIMIKFGLFESGYKFQLENSIGSIYESNSIIMSLSHTTHITKYIYFDGIDFFGIVDVLDTPYGRPLMNLDEELLLLIPIYTIEKMLCRFDLNIKK
jgi:hypothetical protein